MSRLRRQLPSPRCRQGFTLVELVAVVFLVSLVATLVVQNFSKVRRRAQSTAAEADLAAIRDAFLGTSAAPGYLDDMASIPGFSPANLRIANLLTATNLYGIADGRIDNAAGGAGVAAGPAFTSWSEERGRGWRGPYIRIGGAGDSSSTFPSRKDTQGSRSGATAEARGFFPPVNHLALPEAFVMAKDGCSVYGFIGEPALMDPWGNPYVLQIPPPQAFVQVSDVTAAERFAYARVVSAGPDGFLATPCFYPNATNRTDTSWTSAAKSLSRLAGRDEDGTVRRGDDIVLFLNRQDYFEEYE